MGLMNTIRKNPSILIVSIGLAMAGFILMDMLNSGGPNPAGQFTLGEVNGEQIDWKIFSDTENRLYGNSNPDVLGRREVLWNYFVDRILISDLADDLGLGVGTAEMQELQFGNNLSPVIQRNFSDPNTRQVDREQLNQVRQALESGQMPPELKAFWTEQEKEVVKERLQAKVAGMIAKGMFTPTWQAELINQHRNERCDVAYVRIPFDAIPDSEITISDDELAAYLKENPARFRRDEETRALKYAMFPVRPSAADSAALVKTLTDLIPAFLETDNDTLFVENNYGFLDATFFTDEAFTSPEADTLFTLPVGSVYGPFIEGASYMLVKIRDKMIVPDSVKSRHILIQAKDANSLASAQKLIDSLKTVIESGTVSFDTLALQYGQDATRTSGGDLGFTAPGQMVKPFNDLIFYQAEPGKLYTVTTQFGVHLVEVTDRKYINNKTGIQIANLQEPILPSDETQKRVYQKALELVSQCRTLEQLEQAAAKTSEWALETSPLFKENDYAVGSLGEGTSARELIRWAFQQGDAGGVSADVHSFEDPELRYINAYVVAALDRISPAGMPKLENVRSEIESVLRNKKKGEKIAGQIGSQTDLTALATQYGSQVDTALGISFANTFVPGVGNEPRFVGIVTALDAGANSGPIIGTNGVYVANIVNKPTDLPAANIALIRAQVRQLRANTTGMRFAEALRKDAKIEDNRSSFY